MNYINYILHTYEGRRYLICSVYIQGSWGNNNNNRSRILLFFLKVTIAPNVHEIQKRLIVMQPLRRFNNEPYNYLHFFCYLVYLNGIVPLISPESLLFYINLHKLTRINIKVKYNIFLSLFMFKKATNSKNIFLLKDDFILNILS